MLNDRWGTGIKVGRTSNGIPNSFSGMIEEFALEPIDEYFAESRRAIESSKGS